MADFTYRSDLTTDLDRVRFAIQDTTESAGPKPAGANFDDEELTGLVTLEGTWQRAVAAAFEALAGAWAMYADLWVGPRKESLSQVAERYTKLGERWREQYGYAVQRGVYVAGVVRVDGYSDDVASDDVDITSEYGWDFEYVRPE